MHTPNAAQEQLSKNLVEKLIGPWISQLKKAERRPERGPYAFARSADEVTKMDLYYLEDHAWIWQALKCVETHWPELLLDPTVRDKRKGGGATSKKYFSNEAQTHILKRFTLEHPTLKRRMLAVFRSSSETRFLLRSRDTALFHCMDSNFFKTAESENTADVWRSTLLAQASHEENQTYGWESPLRNALALTMACKGWQINRSPRDEIILESKSRLFGSLGANGLFPGFLDQDTKTPEIFQNPEYRDTYWHAAFEIPYVLWMHARGALEQDSPFAGAHDANKQNQHPGNTLGEGERSDGSGRSNQEIRSTKEIVVTGKNVLFNNLINQDSVFEPADEWLYNEPDFLKNDAASRADGQSSSTADSITTGAKRVVGTVVNIWKSPKRSTKNDNAGDALEGLEMMNNDKIDSELRGKRKDQDKLHEPLEGGLIKKRIAWLPCVDSSTVTICCNAAKGPESENMYSFFRRHENFENFFWDGTTAALNTWQTELHLSFYQLCNKPDDHPRGSIAKKKKVHPPVIGPWDNREMKRATMGFRFDGDFFDRYWRCHFVEKNPASSDVGVRELEDLLILDSNKAGSENWKQPWKQRKVLELMLFDKILEKINNSTQQITKDIRKELDNIRQTAAKTTKRRKPISRANSQPFEQILRVLDDDIGENLEHIERWRGRETDRASEQPRWTKNDERRYRTTITKLLNSNAKRIRDLQRCRTNIRSLRTSLESTRAYVRDDLNLRSAEDVRAFTYVTATFLPIGFATSIFSMGGAPDGDLLRNMIKVAGVALAITAVALIFDKILGSVARAIRNFVLHPWNHIVCFIDYLEDSFMELRLKAMPFSPEDADKSTERDFGVEESTKKAFRWRAVTSLRWRPRKERADTDAEVGSRAQI
ncbi:hypothetical protein B0J12DRAFT_573402 [Macrophomina phaseolina]|uniref:Mg2+ transporter protein CorA-like/Zinc transport protein ZntB n=1 Tax=Macrophomina phaseolina TaxID=35725 RepID=A0ABQ8GDG9_9PEZI|nr:hypothetical protein B0J12DRAFT_573402 [Macrophomina phaseolina]